ncbi:endoglucanase [Trifolium repens]|nr:endoglucanase [Trifolium repens]
MILSKSVANLGRVANQTSFPEALPLLKSLSLHFEVGYAQDFDSWYNRIEPNPNVIYGGLVGDLDRNDDYADGRYNMNMVLYQSDIFISFFPYEASTTLLLLA